MIKIPLGAVIRCKVIGSFNISNRQESVTTNNLYVVKTVDKLCFEKPTNGLRAKIGYLGARVKKWKQQSKLE